MKQFIVLAVTATLLGLALASGYNDHSDGYSSHGSRYGSYGRRGYGYGSYYKSCPKLADPENGSVKFYSTKPGSKAIHFCDVGHILNGDKVRVCGKDGTWSGEAPTCEPVDCGQPDPADPNGSVAVGETIFESTATYSCNAGYYIDTVRGGSEVVVCLASGDWSDTAPACKPVDCGHPPAQDENGDVVFTGTTFTNTATYTCNTGFVLQVGGAEVVITCEANAEWSAESAPLCIPVDCGNPDDADSNGEVSAGSNTFRSVRTYSCNDGFLLDTSNGGSVYVECLATSMWSGSAPSCARIDCGVLESPKNGVVDLETDSKLSSIARYSCIRGFRLNGVVTRECLTSGDWSDVAPTCDRIECPALTDPKNGKVIVSGNYVDDRAVYKCSYGFALNGNRYRECQEDGTWSGEDPTCDYDKYDYGHHNGYGDGYGSRPRHGGRYNDKKDY